MLTESQLQGFRSLVSGDVSDAMELLGLRRSVLYSFRSAPEGNGPLVGHAFTVRQVDKRPPAGATESLVRHSRAAAAAGPGSVIVIDVGGRRDVGTWGENQARRAKEHGVAGVVIHGCTRDVGGVRAVGLPTFFLGTSPVKSRWDLETASMGDPVTIDGVTVESGDTIFADEDGILVIAAADTAATLAKALALRAARSSR